MPSEVERVGRVLREKRGFDWRISVRFWCFCSNSIKPLIKLLGS
jgi:hypothetical protein